MYKKTCFFYLLFFVALASCKFNPALQNVGTDFLQGEWAQDSVKLQKKLLNYSLYQFRFSCDSVFITTNNFSKVNYGTDTCMNQGKWKEYVRGKYELHHDTLRVRGLYCNPDFSLKNTGCFHTGVYEDLFKLQKQTDSLFHVTSFSSTVPFNLRLIKRIACNPKPL
ncbi:fumarate hydratase [Mucilaginibacter arboris]|uniref:Fumarate hydratase n=1 Tax=Mucilaginibacter arboris TaxID=2682090 RepID=A0A7K1SS52_9SPHI|nr:fumarate hydratase [Mucilaginibacter arboris]MVN20149.1 fumarate hydratase [Mucilaginibacter arboris]